MRHDRLRPGATIWLLVALLALTFVGCSSDSRESVDEGGADGPAPGVAEPGGDAEEPRTDDDGVNLDDARQVILRASLDLVVENTEETVDAIRSLVGRERGFVESADLRRSGEGDQLQGRVVVRVPSARLDVVLDEIEGLSTEVRSRQLATEDVTSQAVDLDARLTNLRAYEEELLELLTEVRERPGATPEDLLTVFDRISSTRGQIEQLVALRDALAEEVALATVTVSITPSESATPLSESWSPGDIARRSMRSLVAVVQTLTGGLIWFAIVVVPPAAVLLLAGWLVAGVRARRRRGEAPRGS